MAESDVSSLLEGLTPAQRQAVTSEAAPLGILAAAGSGKTRVLTRRIAYRSAQGSADPRRVLALTFTRKAASELSTRLRALGMREQVAAGTFHAMAYAQLRRRWEDERVEPPRLLDRKVGLVANVMGKVVPRRTTTGERVELRPLDLVGEIEWAKARCLAPEQYRDAAVAAGRTTSVGPEAVAAVFRAYEERKAKERLVDFDDLLLLAARLLEDQPEFAATQRWRFRHLFVDEFQDVNPLQHRLLRGWLGDRSDLCVVGDPNQAIYAWNGADFTFLTHFKRHHPGAEVIDLVDNFRSSPQIIAAANAVLGETTARRQVLRATRPDGPRPTVRAYEDDEAEARGIARAVQDAHRPGEGWGAQAVLVRTNAQTALIAGALKAVGVPVRVRGGGALTAQPVVKDALQALRRDTRAIEVVLADLEEQSQEQADGSPAGTEREADLLALVRLGHDYVTADSSPTVAGFLAWLRASGAEEPAGRGDAVEITTFHAAKGLEWPVVHLAGLERGYAPISYAKDDPAALDEEVRLVHVAVTRAERALHCSWAERRTFGTRSSKRSPSPYLDAIERAGRPVGADAAPTGGGSPRERRSRTPRGATPARPDLTPADRALIDQLKAWRRETARSVGKPAFVVFHDRTLEALASARPSDRAALLAVPGVGPAKAEQYGEQVLALVASAPER